MELTAEELEPPHPAFTGFRRMTYLWEEGATTFPIGDRPAVWLDFLHGRAAGDAALVDEAGQPALLVVHPASVDAWTASELEGSALLRGHEAQVRAAAGAPLEHADHEVLGRTAAVLAAAASDAAPTASPVERDALLRAVAILHSNGDGGEVSDVAWPYFLLPERAYPAAARRLLAASVSAWVLPQALEAALVAVNAELPR